MDAASASVSVGASAQYKPIRITAIFDAPSMAALGATNMNFIKAKLVADALEYWRQTLQVIPISGPWYAQRNCIQAWKTTPPVCDAVETDQMCMEAPIPESHFAPLRVCTSCPAQNCVGGACAFTSSGTGVPDTDYVLYVRAVQTANCGNNPMYWGANRGCPFTTDKCIQGNVPVPSDHFCVDAAVDSCSVDLTSRAVCTLRTSTDSIPAYNQYFSNPSLGGSSFADYCPIYTGYKGGDCRLATNLQSPAGTALNLLGEAYGSTSFCLKSTLLTTKNGGWSIPGRTTGCYAMTCAAGVVTISVAGPSGTTQISCSQKGQSVSVTGFTGVLNCPDPAIVCDSGQCIPSCGANAFCAVGKCTCVDGFTSASNGTCISICPNACSGNGLCNTKTTTCTCNTGFGGADCSATAASTKKSNAVGSRLTTTILAGAAAMLLCL
ncbi:hypothetical protein DYB32_002492 [Aphanomyces invadans]|uniref:EGF-like domain-containing protein n=1 Tax=Aphanomyces invadans TaxID=157072 RepID=A0A3R6YCV8_9STRA|nr:hypothetical protein DYB32_002492 [Aphanomyces invadans]